jgi:hypothetical protein
LVRVESEPGAFDQVVRGALSRANLSEIIQRPSLQLYKKERARVPMNEVVENMRKDIRIAPRGDGVVEVAFAYPDRAKAQATTAALVNRLAISMTSIRQNSASLWQRAWPNDPPPAGQKVALVSAPDLPETPVGSTRPIFLAIGTAAGVFAAWLLWRPKRNLGLVGFAVVGAAIALGVSFSIGDRYTSTAVVRFLPPPAPKRVWGVLSPEPFTERFGRLREQIVQADNLAATGERARVRVLKAEDLRIAPSGPDTWLISFTYSDRYKAQSVVREVITQLVTRHMTELRLVKTDDQEVQRAVELGAGPVLEVLDPATLPERPVFPNRLAIGAFGLPLGLVAGVFILRRRRG